MTMEIETISCNYKTVEAAVKGVVEVEKWNKNNKSSEEDKYVDLMESLKKTDVIKEYVSRTLIEKIGENRNIKKVLEIMTEKFSKTTGEKMLDLMKKISNFKVDETIEKLINLKK